MHRPLRTVRSIVLGATALASAPALAAEATQQQADSIQASIHDFFVQMAGPNVPIADEPVGVEPEGDHYTASIALADKREVTADLTDAGGGRWTFGNLHYPSPATFTTSVKGPDGTPISIAYTVTLAGQDGHGVVDTTMATPSSASTTVQGADIEVGDKTQFTSTTHIVTGRGETTLTPRANDTADLVTSSTLEGLTQTISDPKPSDKRTRIEVAKGLVAVSMTGISRDQAPKVVRAVAELPKAQAAGRPDGEAAHALALAIEGFATSARFEETLEGLRVATGDITVDLAHVSFSTEYDASPAGTSAVSLNVLFDGLGLPADIVGPFKSLIPDRFVLPMAVSGVNTQQLLKALQAATEPDRPADAGPPPEFMGMISAPDAKLSVGLMEVKLGDTVVTAKGEGGLAGPAGPAAKGTITATGFDALVDRVKAVPQAAQALPALLFVKGIGRNDGPRIVWDITFDGQKALVNGVDVAAMAGR